MRSGSCRAWSIPCATAKTAPSSFIFLATEGYHLAVQVLICDVIRDPDPAMSARAAARASVMPNSAMTLHVSGATLSAQTRYAAGTWETLRDRFAGNPIRPEYLIVEVGRLAGTGTLSYRNWSGPSVVRVADTGERTGRCGRLFTRSARGYCGPLPRGTPVDVSGYIGLFGEPGAARSAADWVAHANNNLTPNLSALNAQYLDGDRSEKWLRMAYRPGPGSFNVTSLSGGAIAEMLDQAATHCGSLVTGYPCPTLSMTVNIMRAGGTKSFVATGRVLKLTKTNAVLAADLDDDTGRRIATGTVVSALVTDIGRLA